MKSISRSCLLLFMVVVISAFSWQSSTLKATDIPDFKGEIKIGLILPMSGPVPDFGIESRDGVLLAIDEWNSKGGLLGAKIVPILKDGQCDASQASQAADFFVKEKVHYIIGEICSGASIPVANIAENHKIVMVSPTSSQPAVTLLPNGSGKKFVFRTCYIEPYQAQAMARFAISKSYKKAFIFYEQGNDFTRGLAFLFKSAYIESGGEIVGEEVHNSEDTDFSAVLDKVIASKAEVLFVPDYSKQTNLIASQAKQKGVSAVIMGGDGWDSDDLDLVALDGGFYSSNFSPGIERPEVEEFINKYNQKYGVKPNVISVLSYDSANILFTAIQQTNLDDPNLVKDTLAGITFEGVTGKISFDEKHNPKKPVVIIQIKDGKKSFVTEVTP